jgi:hypothetical protein
VAARMRANAQRRGPDDQCVLLPQPHPCLKEAIGSYNVLVSTAFAEVRPG